MFSGTNKADGAFDFWGYAQRTSASVILLNNGENRWYQRGVPGFGEGADGTAAVIQQWADRLGAKDISLIGASMGGSAAVMLGALVGGRVLAFSFEANVRGEGTRSVKYIPADYPLTYPDLKPLIRTSKTPILSILGGGDIIDVVEAHRLRGVENLKLILLRSVDHGVPRYLRAPTDRLTPLLDAFVMERPLPDFPDADNDLEIEGYGEAIAAAHLADLARRPDETLAHAQAALELVPTSYPALLISGRLLAKQGRHREALLHAGAALTQCPREAEARLLYGSCLRRAMRLRQAEAFHRETLLAAPKDHRVLYDLGLVKLAAKDRQGALGPIRAAHELAPANRAYAERLEALEALLKPREKVAPTEAIRKRQAAKRPPPDA